jgi:hypothetical protein
VIITLLRSLLDSLTEIGDEVGSFVNRQPGVSDMWVRSHVFGSSLRRDDVLCALIN